jgi:hypothetical protein
VPLATALCTIVLLRMIKIVEQAEYQLRVVVQIEEEQIPTRYSTLKEAERQENL